MRDMAPTAASSHAKPLPITDRRSAEAKYLQQVRDELRAHVGGAPSIVQRLLIDRAAHTTLRLHGLDVEPVLPDNTEFLGLSRLLLDLLLQLGVQQPASGIVRAPLRDAAA